MGLMLATLLAHVWSAIAKYIEIVASAKKVDSNKLPLTASPWVHNC